MMWNEGSYTEDFIWGWDYPLISISLSVASGFQRARATGCIANGVPQKEQELILTYISRNSCYVFLKLNLPFALFGGSDLTFGVLLFSFSIGELSAFELVSFCFKVTSLCIFMWIQWVLKWFPVPLCCDRNFKGFIEEFTIPQWHIKRPNFRGNKC